jgi:hypothetical protein
MSTIYLIIYLTHCNQHQQRRKTVTRSKKTLRLQFISALAAGYGAKSPETKSVLEKVLNDIPQNDAGNVSRRSDTVLRDSTCLSSSSTTCALVILSHLLSVKRSGSFQYPHASRRKRGG